MRPQLSAACVLLVLAGQVQAQSTNDVEQCAKEKDSRLRIGFCSAAIESGQVTGPDLGKLFARRAGAYYENRDVDHAIADCDQALRLDAQNIDAFNVRGVSYEAKLDYEHALQDFDQSIRLRPDNYFALSNRALIYEEEGEFDRALQDFGQNIRLHPDDYRGFSDRGDLFETRGDYDRAISDYNQANRLNPNAVWIFYRRGDAYSDKGDYAHALQDYDQVIRMDALYADLTFTKRGHMKFFLGKFAAADEDFSREVNARPMDPYAVLWHYLAQARAGQPAQAELSRNVLRVDPIHWPIEVIHLYLGEETPEQVLAARYTSEYLERERRLQALFYVGEYALLHGDKKQAIQRFRDCVSIGVKQPIEYSAAKAELQHLSATTK